ncbi:MAG: OsmC family protein [Jannaschia sp.]
MHSYGATVRWESGGADVGAGRYSRAHTWNFDGGLTVAASASPTIVPAPWSDATAVDPEEAFVASVASCHMLWFLDIARTAGFMADTYSDTARGQMTRNPDGDLWISRIDLCPEATWTGTTPGRNTLRDLHNNAHERCFIANSVRSEIILHIP